MMNMNISIKIEMKHLQVDRHDFLASISQFGGARGLKVANQVF